MKSREEILTLVSEISDELNSLRILGEEIREVEEKISQATSEDKRYFLKSAALELHNLYTGCERIFEKIAGEINGALPSTPDWHNRLLKQMSIPVDEVRPAVISADLAKILEEYLKFRHVVRNIYGFELDSERMKPLISNGPKVVKDFSAQIKAFLDFLKELIK